MEVWNFAYGNIMLAQRVSTSTLRHMMDHDSIGRSRSLARSRLIALLDEGTRASHGR
jgi:hypothetical protein